MRGQRHALAVLYPRERPDTHCAGGWVGPRAGLDRCGKSRPHRDSIPGPSSPWPVAVPTELPDPCYIIGRFIICIVHDSSIEQLSKSGLVHLIVEVSTRRSHTIRHTQPVGLLLMSNQLVTEATTYTTHNIHKRRTSMPSAGFETAIPAIDPLHTYTLDRTTTRTGP